MIKRLPALVDTHVHGAIGRSVMRGLPEIREIGEYLALNGVYGWFPTTVTASWDEILYAVSEIVKASRRQSPSEARILGVHIEGPFLNPDFHGAQPVQHILQPTIERAQKLLKVAEGLPLIVTLAPEAPGAFEVMHWLAAHGAVVSIGHSGATFEQMQRAFGMGVKRVTHLYNAMRFFHHREPGPIGATLYSDAFAEIIVDGVHVHPAIIGVTLKAKGFDRVVFVSDGTEVMGLEEGTYTIGGRHIRVEKGAAYEDSNLIGSATLLKDGILNLARWLNIPLEVLWACGSTVPLDSVGMRLDLPLYTVTET
ncbi:amidohydrolase family protein [Coprothermobacteraceae bacterium]|nr:amidohydrolase family protein [Coprothermobacteraceae bacterium]